MVDGAVANVSTDLSHLEPVNMTRRLGGALDGTAHGVLNAHLRCSDNLNQSISALHDVQPNARRAGSQNERYRYGVPTTRAQRDSPPDVFTITGAQRGLSQEQTGRTRRYLISMGIRTGCVIAAIIVPGWPKWVFLAGAVVLPYLAVVIANGGRENDEAGELGVSAPLQQALPPGQLRG